MHAHYNYYQVVWKWVKVCSHLVLGTL
jgi:hypothetical protein